MGFLVPGGHPPCRRQGLRFLDRRQRHVRGRASADASSHHRAATTSTYPRRVPSADARRIRPPSVYAGLHSVPHPDTGFDLNASSSAVGGSHASMGYGRHQYPWAPQAGWAGSSQQYPPPIPPGRGAHDEGALCGQKGCGRGRCGRVHCSGAAPPSPSQGSSRGRSQTRNTLTIGSSSNSGIGNDRDNDDDGDDSDYTSDNNSSVINFAFSTYYCFCVSIESIAVLPSLLIPA